MFTLNIRSRCRRLSLSHSYSTRAERTATQFYAIMVDWWMMLPIQSYGTISLIKIVVVE